MVVMEVADLRRSYGSQIAVHSVSLRLHAGKIVGLLGPNGAGKSTLIRMLTLELQPDQGRISLSGEDALRRPMWAKAQIGLVPQEIVLYDELTAADNLMFFGAIYGLQGMTLRKRADELLVQVGLWDRRGDTVDKLSGGMKRRLNIAAGIMHAPAVIFMDEPTVGVDPQSRSYIFSLVQQLAAEGRAILYTTHYMEEAQALCNEVQIIDHGRIIATGSPGELIAEYGDGDVIELEFGVQPEPALEFIRLHASLQLLEIDGHVVRCLCKSTHSVLVALIKQLSELGCNPKSIHIHQPNLEAVFLRLTGRKLRD
jgi:ABC-2 type transport system ATP-binding protein